MGKNILYFNCALFKLQKKTSILWISDQLLDLVSFKIKQHVAATKQAEKCLKYS